MKINAGGSPRLSDDSRRSPVYVWVLLRRRALQSEGLFGKYVLLYLFLAGISLVIDLLDLIRYLLGDG